MKKLDAPPTVTAQLVAEKTGISKACARCKCVKLVDEFRAHPRSRDGLASYCLDCHRQSVRDSRRRYRAKYNARRRENGHNLGPIYNMPRDAPEYDYMQAVRRDLCAYCGAPASEIDHIVPNGDNDWSNLTSACGTCNKRKGRMSLLGWMGRRQMLSEGFGEQLARWNAFR